MLFIKCFSRLSLLTATSIISSIFLTNLSAKAATFSSSEASLLLNNFSITAQNPAVDSNSTSIAITNNSLSQAQADAEANIAFIANSEDDFLRTDLYSESSGDGNSFFGFGEASSLAIGNFFIGANQTFSFDFTTSLALLNEVNSPLDESISSFSGVDFFLFDHNTNDILSNFLAISNIDTNLTENIDNDFILVDSSDIFFQGEKFEDFGRNIESADLSLSGSFERLFNTATEVRLEVSAFSRSCVQAPLTNDPCTRIPEPNTTTTLLFGFLGLGLVSLLNK